MFRWYIVKQTSPRSAKEGDKAIQSPLIYSGYTLREVGLEEYKFGFKISGTNLNNLYYTDITLFENMNDPEGLVIKGASLLEHSEKWD